MPGCTAARICAMSQLRLFYCLRALIVLAGAIYFAGCGTQSSAVRQEGTGSATVAVKRLSADDPRYRVVSEKFIDACKMEMVGDYQAALNLYQEVIRLDPANDAAYFNIAQILYGRKQYVDALAYAQQAVRLDPQNGWYLGLLGTLYGGIGKFKEAQKIYEQLVQLQPLNPEHWYNWSFFSEQANDIEQAIAIANRFEEQFGVTEDFSVQKAKLWMALKKPDKAAAELRKLIASDPANPNYHYRLIDFLLQQGKTNDARLALEQLLMIDPDALRAQMLLAEIYERQGDIALADTLLTRVFTNSALDEDLGTAFLFPFLSAFQTDDSAARLRQQRAIRYATLFATTHPQSAKVHALLGDFLYQDEQWEAALQAYQKSLSLYQGVFAVWQQVFFIYDHLQRYDSLVAMSKRCMELFPQQMAVYYFNGYGHVRIQQYAQAVESLQKAIRLGSAEPRFMAQIYALCGDAYFHLSNYTASDSCFERALYFDSSNALVLNNYSYYLSLRGERLDEALAMAKKANDTAPNTAAYQDTYGWILYKMKRYEEAKFWIGKALENNGTLDGTILEHYGDVLYQLGEADEALRYWQKAKSAQGASELIDRKIADQKLYE